MRRFGLLFVFISSSLWAQRNFTMEEAVLGGRAELAPQRLRHLQFSYSGNEVSFVDDTKENHEFILINKDGKRTLLFRLDEFNDAMKKASLREGKTFPFMYWKSKSQLEFVHSDYHKWNFDIATKTIRKSDDTTAIRNFENGKSSTDEKWTAYTQNNNLFIHRDNKEVQLTNDGGYDVVYGQAVHRNEFGIEEGIFVSPSNSYFAFYRMDQSMVTDYPIINWLDQPAKNENIKYPFAGDKSHQVTIGIYSLSNNKIHYLKIEGDPEQYLTNIQWSPDEKLIYVALVNRGQNHMWLNAYDVATGQKVSTLFEEKDEKYIEPMHPMMFVKNDPNHFIWQSNRDGFKHLYLYARDGKLVRQLTKGEWEIKELNGFDESGKFYFFHCNIDSPISNDLCKVELSSGKVTRLTKNSGTHNCVLNGKGTMAIDYYSSPKVPRTISVLDLKSGKSIEIFNAPDPLKGYNCGSLKMFSIKNKENTDLYCRMFLPVNFDSTKKYPVVVYLYNGPHSQLVTNSWLGGADLWYHYMAQQGVIMFTLDGRGTDNRGKAFSQAIHRRLGKAEMEDQMSGVEWLKKQTYVDGSRMGVHGWSFGGFMTSSLMTRYPGVFKVAVAGGPVIDWRFYEIMYGERYMDSPQENPAGYKENNVLNHIGKLKGKLLLIHGTDDDVVVWQHSLMLLHKAVEQDVLLDYYVYPGHKHNVRGKDRVHLMKKISEYLLDELK